MKKIKEIRHHPIFKIIILLVTIWIISSLGIYVLEDFDEGDKLLNSFSKTASFTSAPRAS